MTPQKAKDRGAAKPSDWSTKMQQLRERKPVEQKVTVWLNDDAKSGMERARHALAAAESIADAYSEPTTDEQRALLAEATRRLEEAQADVDRAREAVETGSIDLWFRGLGRPAYEALIGQHPPTDEQKENGQVYNDETFAPALIAATHIHKQQVDEEGDGDGQPTHQETGESMTVEEATELLEVISQTDAMALYAAAVGVCVARRVDVDNGRARA